MEWSGASGVALCPCVTGYWPPRDRSDCWHRNGAEARRGGTTPRIGQSLWRRPYPPLLHCTALSRPSTSTWLYHTNSSCWDSCHCSSALRSLSL